METATGPTEHESRSVPHDAAKTLHTELKMGAGTLKVTGGSSDWMRGEFSYNVPSWKPNVRYTATDGRGELLVEQPSGSSHTNNTTNEWDLHLNNEVPTDLIAHVGAGEVHMDIGSLALRSLRIDIGAGELRLDLRGKPTHDYDVNIRGGAGEATIHLPKDVGIYAKASGGLGEINVTGLRAGGDHWENDAYTAPGVKIHLDVQGGVGAIHIIAE